MSTKKRVIKLLLQLLGAGALVFVDQLLKNLVASRLKGENDIVLIKGVLGFTYAENTGAAFSLFSDSTTALSVVTGAALILAMFGLFAVKRKPLIYDVCVPLIVAGGAGNLLDRVTRGYVIDYIRTLFIDFPVFNFADCLITCSCFAIMFWLIYEMIRDSKRERARRRGEDAK